jgi:urocanate hydratase
VSDLAGKVLVTSGLGGMSGAQPKAAKICGCVSVTAEIDEKAAKKRHAQGWVDMISSSLDDVMRMVKQARSGKANISIAYVGNIVDLLERFAEEEENIVDLGSDQTSLHNPYNGGYYPVGVSFEESNKMMYADPPKFKELVQASLRRHVNAINKLVARGMSFWDYGNSFLLEAGRAGADIFRDDSKSKFKYPSYVEDIMGDIFSLGFGPFRWVCSSGDPADLEITDKVAGDICEKLSGEADEWSKMQYEDNLKWIRQAGPHKLVVGSQARILYSDQVGRSMIAQAFNDLVRDGKLKGPVIISRDHHDVSGTDSPYRETSNITDGSYTTADMAVQNFVGDAFRGATWCALHNGGGTGWGMAMNGGFGLVLDGSADASRRASEMLFWDVLNGVSRRAWGRNANAEHVIEKAQQVNPNLKVTMPNHADDNLLDGLFQ